MINNLSVFLLFATSFLLGCNHAFSFVSSNHHRQHQSRVTLRLSSTSTFGPAIQDAQSTHDLLSISLWLPTDDNLLPHIRSQHIHHEKRQRWAAQWLTRFMELHPSGEDASIFDEKAFVRTVLAVAMPYDDTTPPTRKETQAIRQSLVALHTLLRTNSKKGVATFCVDHKMIAGIQMLIQRAEQMALTIPLQEAVEVRWAARGLMASHHSLKNLALPQLEQRVARLPFDILPCGVTDLQSVSAWQQDIPFQFDTIITRTGTNVPERRGTAWVAQEGIGALAYSGKLMAPHPLPASVASVMRQVEQAMGRTDDSFFDCALCNWYPYGESACKFHTDPEHGTMWDRLTCVVAAGDARRFAFRPIQTSWEDWDPNQHARTSQTNGINNEPAVIRLFPGDIVKMHDTCNDDFHHAVYPDADGRGRVSLVLKRALPRGSKGQRGHGLVGEGRRSRRKR